MDGCRFLALTVPFLFRSVRFRPKPFRSFDRSVHFGLEPFRSLNDRLSAGTFDRSITVQTVPFVEGTAIKIGYQPVKSTGR